MFHTSGFSRRNSAFTLIELLIVVAIIAILAAIAVPNFLEAQTRAKVSRVKADQRSLATALESYLVDNNRYPVSLRAVNARWATLPTRQMIYSQITTPIAYVTSAFPDPFNVVDADPGNRMIVYWSYDTFGTVTSDPYTATLPFNNNYNIAWAGFPNMVDPLTNQLRTIQTWTLLSLGPDRRFDILRPSLTANSDSFPSQIAEYDPTNGTISRGDVIRFRQ
jgi:prepilin-type N-terminal cleavage/methylation domain-containing protein